MYPPALERLVEAFARFPGVGRRTAERLAFHVLRVPDEEASAFARAVEEARASSGRCSVCHNVAETDPCAVCADPARDRRTICVVEEPRDVWALEKARVYRGLYHVLLGSLNPAEGSGPEALTIDALVRRVRAGGIEEVILATDPDLEGDGTALLVGERLAGTGVRLTRLARGLPAGTAIEYLNKLVLADAIEGRRDVNPRTARG